MLLLTLCTAFAGDVDFAAEATRRMKLDFDLDEVEGRLERRPAARASMVEDPYSAAPYDPWPTAPLPLEPNSDLRDVTVFRDRAFVTRHRAVKLGAGSHTVTFEGLPLALVEEGLRASVEGTGGRVVGVEVAAGVGEVSEDERTEAIRLQAKDLTAQLGEVRDRIESLLAQRAYVRAALIPDGATSTPPL